MACYTGLILAGTPHPNDGGFLYTHAPRQLWLSENSRPAWCLDNTATAIRDGRRYQTVWIPHRPSCILEDGILMIAALVLKIKEIRSILLGIISRDEFPERLDLSKSISNDQHKQLITLSRKLSHGYLYKLIIAFFDGHGTSITNQVAVLSHYEYEIELLSPCYSKLYSRWLKADVIRGSLTDLRTIKNERVIKYSS